MTNLKSLELVNVNGFNLSLKVDESGCPKSITFTITYKNNKFKCNWSRMLMIFTLILYAGSFIYTYMSLKSILISGIIISILLIFWAKHTVKSESLTVVPTVGIQSSVKYVIGHVEKMVPWCNIDDVIINEVIRMNRVLYILSVLVKHPRSPNSEQGISVLPLFENTKPKLEMIDKIYSEISQILTQQVEACTKTQMDHVNALNKQRNRGDVLKDKILKENSHGDVG